ncbi:hypothetical protein Pelo_13813 [Pelomyxa schiedti]|nr:hypothetical protein Pelo_13813 [Pelomyxa schiedti]
MFPGMFTMIMCSPLGTPGYNDSLKSCAEILQQQTPQFHSGGEFSLMLKLILAKLHLKDWSSLQGQYMVIVIRKLQEQLPLAVNYGAKSTVEVHHDQIETWSTGEVFPHTESVTVSGLNIPISKFNLQADCESEHIRVRDELKSCFEKYLPMPQSNFGSWHSQFREFVTLVIESRKRHVMAWVSSNMKPEWNQFPEAQNLLTQANTAIQQLETLKLCTDTCTECPLSCSLLRIHSGKHCCWGCSIRTLTGFRQPTFHIQVAEVERLLDWVRLQHVEYGTHFTISREKDTVEGPADPPLARFIATEIFSVRTLPALGYQCRALVIGSNLQNSRHSDPAVIADFLQNTCHITVMEAQKSAIWKGTLERFLAPIGNPDSSKVASIFYFAGTAKQVGSRQHLLLADGSASVSSSTTDLIMPLNDIVFCIAAQSHLVIAIIDTFQPENTVGGQLITHSGAFSYRPGTEQLAQDRLPTGCYLVLSVNPGCEASTKRIFTSSFREVLLGAAPGTPFDNIVECAVTQVQILTCGHQCPFITDTISQRFALF